MSQNITQPSFPSLCLASSVPLSLCAAQLYPWAMRLFQDKDSRGHELLLLVLLAVVNQIELPQLQELLPSKSRSWAEGMCECVVDSHMLDLRIVLHWLFVPLLDDHLLPT